MILDLISNLNLKFPLSLWKRFPTPNVNINHHHIAGSSRWKFSTFPDYILFNLIKKNKIWLGHATTNPNDYLKLFFIGNLIFTFKGSKYLAKIMINHHIAYARFSWILPPSTRQPPSGAALYPLLKKENLDQDSRK